MYIFEVVAYFSYLVAIQSSQFSVAVHIKIHIFDEAFFLLTIRMSMSCDLLQGALTHKYAQHINGVVLWGHATNKIHISTCRRCMDTKLGKVPT